MWLALSFNLNPLLPEERPSRSPRPYAPLRRSPKHAASPPHSITSASPKLHQSFRRSSLVDQSASSAIYSDHTYLSNRSDQLTPEPRRQESYFS